MTTLLTFREWLKTLYSRYEYIITPILKFILAIIVFTSLNRQFGYMPTLNKPFLVIVTSLICTFLPTELITAIGGVIVVAQSFKASPEAALISLVFVLIFYFGYMRFVTKTGIIVLLVPICYTFHLTYALPVVLGFLVGPTAIIPVIFGLILYYYRIGLSDLVNVLATSADEEESVQGFRYILSGLLQNKQMLLEIVVFACVILITYLIYRLSFEHAWVIAFITGGLLNVILFLVGSVMMMIDVDILSILLGSLAGILLALLIQFGKGIVDYQRTELLQFEDDDYYYYVKAIPKLSISESNVNVKHINFKRHE